MARIKLRHPNGAEYSFQTAVEFERALAGGRITEAWQIFHGRCGAWLPVEAHPAFRRVLAELTTRGGLPAA